MQSTVVAYLHLIKFFCFALTTSQISTRYGLIWLSIGTDDGLLRCGNELSCFIKQRISLQAEVLLASQEGICSMKLELMSQLVMEMYWGAEFQLHIFLKSLLWNKEVFCLPRAFYIRENNPYVYKRPFAGIVEKGREPYLCGEANPDPSVVRPVSQSLCQYSN